MSNQHVLKIHPAPLADLLSGAKTAEVRRNDRDFQVGDTVRLMEVNPETGNWTGAADQVCTITHIQTGYGLPDDLCVLSYGKVGHDYKAHWMGFMDRTDWMQEKGQVPAKYLGQHRADILTDMLREAREALVRVEADHEANSLEYGEALILIGQVLDCRSLEDLNAVRRYLNEFMDRYSLRPVPDVDIVQAEQQEAGEMLPRVKHLLPMPAVKPPKPEAQGAQAGGERAAFEHFIRSRYPKTSLERIDRPGAEAHGEYESSTLHVGWIIWQARAALATQPAAGEPVYQVSLPNGTGWSWYNASQDVYHQTPPSDRRILYTAPPAAAHGDDGRTCRFCQKRFDSAGECGNHVDQFHHGEAEPAAMRAQGDDRLLFTDAIMPGGLTET